MTDAPETIWLSNLPHGPIISGEIAALGFAWSMNLRDDCTQYTRTDTITPAMAAKVLLSHLLNLEESDVWEVADDAMSRDLADAGDVVLAALRAIVAQEE